MNKQIFRKKRKIAVVVGYNLEIISEFLVIFNDFSWSFENSEKIFQNRKNHEK